MEIEIITVEQEIADRFHNAFHDVSNAAHDAAARYMESVRADSKVDHYEAARRMMGCQRDLQRLHDAIGRFQDKYAKDA